MQILILRERKCHLWSQRLPPLNPCRVVVSYGGAAVKELHFFRSFHHPRPNVVPTSDDGNDVKEKHIKSLNASDQPLWKIGRATSAAPTYFEAMEIGDETFKDGGLKQANNPVRLAYNEVKQMHWRHEPRLIISIGTGIKPAREEIDEDHLFENIREVWRDNKVFKRAILNSETQHEDFHNYLGVVNKDLADEDKVKYFRFNVPAGVPPEFNITDIKLGEWKGKEGVETIHKMTDAVREYVGTQEERLENCAKELVRIRRQRQRTERWERFALHLVYCCPETGGHCGGRLFDSRLKLRQHAVRTHGFVWQVPCVRSDGTTAHDWACYWEQCENQVSVFDTEDDLKKHLQEKHKMPTPAVVPRRQFEEWLDRGRHVLQPSPSRQQTGLSIYS